MFLHCQRLFWSHSSIASLFANSSIFVSYFLNAQQKKLFKSSNENSFAKFKQKLFFHFQFLKQRFRFLFGYGMIYIRPHRPNSFRFLPRVFGTQCKVRLVAVINDFMACPHEATKTIVYISRKYIGREPFYAAFFFFSSPFSTIVTWSENFEQ